MHETEFSRRLVVHGQQIPVLQNASHRPFPPIEAEVEAEGEESGARGAGGEDSSAAPRWATTNCGVPSLVLIHGCLPASLAPPSETGHLTHSRPPEHVEPPQN
jgi:hypothetical protein